MMSNTSTSGLAWYSGLALTWGKRTRHINALARQGHAPGGSSRALFISASVAFTHVCTLTTAAQIQDLAQPTAAPAVSTAETPNAPVFNPHPATAISARVNALRMAQRTHNVVVIVPDSKSYIEAIGKWRANHLVPVLIDDGSEQSREDIARFVRAFKPLRVVRWSADAAENKATPNLESFATVDPVLVYSAMGRVFATTTASTKLSDILDGWKPVNYNPPGIVFTSVNDPAWTAALALAAGRGQALVFLDPAIVQNRVNASMTLEQIGAIAVAIEDAAKSLGGLEWGALGDSIDAITLCVHIPVKYAVNAKELLSTTDLLGRHDASQKFERWAWTGQVIGTSSQAAYRAMCSLFLQPSEAWIFDGYKNEPPFDAYDGTVAAVPFRAVNIMTRVDDAPDGSSRQWRLRGARVSNAGVVFVGTMGNADFFDLSPGRCRPGDVPFLNVPTIVHMIHSWSAERPTDRDTLAARWLERGAHVYAGSVNEPYLNAFVTPRVLASRLVGGMIFGAAIRADIAQPWKITVLGDPLTTVGDPMMRTADPSPFEAPTLIPMTKPMVSTDVAAPDPIAEKMAAEKMAAEADRLAKVDPSTYAVAVRAGLRRAMVEGKWAEALNMLRLEGRDADGVKLIESMLAKAAGTKPASPESLGSPIDAAAARIAIPMLLRQGSTRTLLDLAKRCHATKMVKGSGNDARDVLVDPVVRDAIWLSAYPVVSSGGEDALLAMLKQCVRDDQRSRDVGLLAMSVMRRADFAGALTFLRTWREEASQEMQKAIDEVIGQKPEEWGEM